MALKKSIKKKSAVKNKLIKSASANKKIGTKPRECSHFNAWSISIYIYWFIILFFISATFYILGRSHSLINSGSGEQIIAEESLKSENDYAATGRQKLMNGQIDDAISDLNIALNTKNPSTNVYVLRAQAFMQLGNYKNSIDDLTNAIELDSNNAVAYYNRALLKTRIEDFSGAMVDINSALAASANNPDSGVPLRDIYAKRGKLNLWLKNWNGAISDYTNSLFRDEGTIDSAVYAERAEAYTVLGEYSKAKEDYVSAIRVIAEQIQGIKNRDAMENLSVKAMGYFEKSAALNVRIGDLKSAKSDLESAYKIATSLNDTDAMIKLENLINGLN